MIMDCVGEKIGGNLFFKQMDVRIFRSNRCVNFWQQPLYVHISQCSNPIFHSANATARFTTTN